MRTILMLAILFAALATGVEVVSTKVAISDDFWKFHWVFDTCVTSIIYTTAFVAMMCVWRPQEKWEKYSYSKQSEEASVANPAVIGAPDDDEAIGLTQGDTD